jgi:hypothetical protein
MSLKFILCLILSYSFAYPSSLKVSEGEKYVNVKIKEHKNIHYNDICFKGPTIKCEAFEATKIKIELSESKTGFVGHPAARYCHDRKAMVRILIAEDKKQYDFCLFKDGSMVDAWELFYKHFPKPTIN